MKSGSTVRHVDGMSSDDEMTELEATAFRNQKGKVGSMRCCFLLQVTAVDCVAQTLTLKRVEIFLCVS